MARSPNQGEDHDAWNRIESLGGHGVWDGHMVVVSLADTGVTDEDLSLFQDFPHVQILDLSHTAVGDGGMAYLAGLCALEALIIVDTQISEPAIKAFQRTHPSVKITTEPLPKDAVNPFTGKPFCAFWSRASLNFPNSLTFPPRPSCPSWLSARTVPCWSSSPQAEPLSQPASPC